MKIIVYTWDQFLEFAILGLFSSAEDQDSDETINRKFTIHIIKVWNY